MAETIVSHGCRAGFVVVTFGFSMVGIENQAPSMCRIPVGQIFSQKMKDYSTHFKSRILDLTSTALRGNEFRLHLNLTSSNREKFAEKRIKIFAL